MHAALCRNDNEPDRQQTGEQWNERKSRWLIHFAKVSTHATSLFLPFVKPSKDTRYETTPVPIANNIRLDR